MKRLISFFIVILFFNVIAYSGSVKPIIQRPNKIIAEDSTYLRVVNSILNSDEIFIQFRNIYSFGGSSLNNGGVNSQYVAIIVEPNEPNCKVKYLFDSDKLLRFKPSECDNPKLGQIIWEKLSDEIRNKSNIYFSISGDLYNYPIEYVICPDDTTKFMNEKYGMFRLSEIEQLARKHDFVDNNSNVKKAVVFGGLEFDNDSIEVSANSPLEFRQSVRKLKMLPATLEEATYIDSLLRRHSYLVSLQVGNSGTKSNFKKISDSDVSLVHLASHGKYSPHHYNENESDIFKWMMDKTGICLARENINEYDGFLSGLEISDLDLNNLEFVVLSACQTGLGDIFEGQQYGLLNAFKESHIYSMLATLWSVEDRSTKIFMNKFYELITDGMSANDAICHAQQFLRSYSDSSQSNDIQPIFPFKDPKYWAPFILVDFMPMPRDVYESENTNLFIKKFKLNNLLSEFVKEDLDFWNQYSHLMKKDDALIYFYNYNIPDGETEYVVHILTLDNPGGVIIPLSKECYNNGHVEFWEKNAELTLNCIKPYIEDKNRIFLRPTGIFSKTPLESLWETENSNKKFYRISSGKTLRRLGQNDTIQLSDAVLIGGIESGSLVAYLPASKLEIDSIGYNLRTAGVNTVIISNLSATKDQLSNYFQNPNINLVHFSGHTGNLSLNDGCINYTSLIDAVLDNSFIICSDSVKSSKLNTNRYEVPVLTALDISKMDLSHIDLWVMAGSNSLFGSSTSCNNYGLAYGLTEAGVKTIIGNVGVAEDMATFLFMKNLYANLLSGLNIHDAFNNAKMYLRNYEKVVNGKVTRPYQHPKYWAGYILLDGIGESINNLQAQPGNLIELRDSIIESQEQDIR